MRIRNSGGYAMIHIPRRAAALTGVSLLTIVGFGCGFVATEPSVTRLGGAGYDSVLADTGSPVVLHRSGSDEFLYVTNVTSSTISGGRCCESGDSECPGDNRLVDRTSDGTPLVARCGPTSP